MKAPERERYDSCSGRVILDGLWRSRGVFPGQHIFNLEELHVKPEGNSFQPIHRRRPE